MDLDDLQSLGLKSNSYAASIEEWLGIRFSEFTPEQRDTWRRQTLCLKQYTLTPDYERATQRAGVPVAVMKAWERFNVLGFAKRKEVAELEYTETIQMLLHELALKPDSPTTLLLALLRKHIPENYGHARRISGRTKSKVLRQGGRGVPSNSAGR